MVWRVQGKEGRQALKFRFSAPHSKQRPLLLIRLINVYYVHFPA